VLHERLLKHPKNKLALPKSKNNIPMLNPHYTEENIRNGIEPVYIQSKAFQQSRFPKLTILVSYFFF
jgi:hypothetical protein